MDRIEGDGVRVSESTEETRLFFSKSGLVHYILLVVGSGVCDCLQTLEHTHYTPKTDRNDLFILRYLKWEDLDWFIVSIPFGERGHMDRVALAHNLRIADGVPVMITENGICRFPINGENCYTLENLSRYGRQQD